MWFSKKYLRPAAICRHWPKIAYKSDQFEVLFTKAAGVNHILVLLRSFSSAFSLLQLIFHLYRVGKLGYKGSTEGLAYVIQYRAVVFFKIAITRVFEYASAYSGLELLFRMQLIASYSTKTRVY